jgi:protein involved in polysaccharide export with SLBB domain
MISMSNKNLLRLIIILLSSSFVTACQTTTQPPVQALPDASPHQTPRLTLKAGDVVEIKFAYASQFNENQTVRPDGKIELQLIGEVVAQGKSPSELRKELIGLYSTQLKHPELAVVVRSFYERRIFVGGEVNKPGPIDIPGEMTALEAIMQAGGFNLEKAEVRNVVVVRNLEGRMVGQSLDFKEALAGREAQPFYLQPRDIVYVPRTTITDVDQWISQYLWKVLPPIYFSPSIPVM